jgi:nucleotide-binding universal stress UspA family protein
MKKVLAALDNSLAAQPALTAALALGRLLDARVEAIHVQVNGDRIPRGAADGAGVALTTANGPVVERILDLAQAPEVAAVVLGARGTPGGRRPLGSTALAVATGVPKPVVVVPPDAVPSPTFRRVLVPIEDGLWSALMPSAIVEVARGTEVDVVVLHVHEEPSLPAFTDQPQHEQPAWAREFLRRYCPWGIGAVELQTRIGRSEELVPTVARQAKVDLIALAWSQELAEGRAPVVRAVLMRARAPVMLVPVRVAAAVPTTAR